MEFNTKLKTKDIIGCLNIADKLSKEDLASLGEVIHKNFENDLNSRAEWEKRNDESLKLALQVTEQKSFPWPGAANVKFPLITIAALQYHARSYPVLINSDQIVKCRVFGDDKDGMKQARAERVENHMSYQILEQDVDWESEMDKVLITQPIIGCAFKKTYFDPIKKHNISENILAKDLVVNYWTKSLDTAPRITQIMYLSKNDIYERVSRGLWLEESTDGATSSVEQSRLGITKDKVQGISQPEVTDSSTPIEILEQHCYLDLDGDGYEEPYIVFMNRKSKQIRRITARYFDSNIEWKDKDKKDVILSIKPETYFTKYPFIPSPDGGFYDLGFGSLLGPLNESINTIINQLVDAGTMSNTAGGFLSRGIKLRSGTNSFAPNEWKPVDTTGDDLRKGIMPLPVREPSNVLFTLLNLLINYGERIGGSVDILTGQNPGQNTPAETSRTMAEQGMKIFSGIFKRTYRSLRDEFRKMYRLNQLYLDDKVEYMSDAVGIGIIKYDDYRGDVSDVRPTADPHIVSDSQRAMQATMLTQRASQVQGYNTYEVEKAFLKSLRVSNIDQVFPDPKGPNAVPPAVNPKIQIEQIKAQSKQASDELQFKLGLMQLMQQAEESQAKVHKLEAEALMIFKQAQDADKQHKLNEINTMIGLAKERRETILSSINTMSKVFLSNKPEPVDVTLPQQDNQG